MVFKELNVSSDEAEKHLQDFLMYIKFKSGLGLDGI